MNKETLIQKIKEKKELSGLDDSVILEVLEKAVSQSKVNLQTAKKAEIKDLIKKSRAELRKFSGRFTSSFEERLSLLKENKIQELIKTHSSTRERLDFYPTLNNLIKNLRIKSILDLGCGLNPIAIAFENPRIEYYPCDINNNDLKIVKEFFKKENISGKVFFYDLRKKDQKLPKVDLCLIMKVFDVVEQQGHKLAERIINSVNAKYFLISFSTKTLSGKPMNHPQRGWIERLLSRLGYNFQIINHKNEIFYLASKTKESVSL
ncbi:methyltransferase [Candidatus Pacearchaeota archaeon]|nr:methyltransferase [Candidatus Pacearchaeota archaeon]